MTRPEKIARNLLLGLIPISYAFNLLLLIHVFSPPIVHRRGRVEGERCLMVPLESLAPTGAIIDAHDPGAGLCLFRDDVKVCKEHTITIQLDIGGPEFTVAVDPRDWHGKQPCTRVNVERFDGCLFDGIIKVQRDEILNQ